MLTPNDLIEEGEEIPHYAWLAFPLDVPTDEDINWAKKTVRA